LVLFLISDLNHLILNKCYSKQGPK